MPLLSRRRKGGFTLIELIVVIAVLAIIVAAVFASLDPVKRLNVSRNNRRRSDVAAIAQAAAVRIADQLPMTDVSAEWKIIGTGPAGSCALPCSTILDALHFGGNGARIDAGSMSALNFDGSQSFSISLWIKVDEYVTGESHDILTKMETENKGYRLAIGDGYPSFIIMDEPANGRYVRSVLLGEPIVEAGGGYYHLVMTFNHLNSADPIHFFLNGTQLLTLPDAGTLSANTLATNTASFVIGGRNNPPLPPSFRGSIDDVRVYQGVLSQGDVDLLFAHDDPADPLLAHWDFDEGTGTSVTESVSSDPATFSGLTWTQGISTIAAPDCADLQEELVDGGYLPALPVNVGVSGAVPSEQWTYYAIRRQGAAVEVRSCVAEGEGDGGGEPFPDITASR